MKARGGLGPLMKHEARGFDLTSQTKHLKFEKKSFKIDLDFFSKIAKLIMSREN